jgi:hypothetical protein
MNKEFIPYEEALALKELGFDEPCFGYYHDKRLTGVNKWDRKDFEFHILSKKEVTATTVEIVIAPLYQQAFRWFREKYGYWSYIKEATKGTCRFYIEKFDEKFFNSDIIDSYEEAELACLIKLIKIVKEKKQ